MEKIFDIAKDSEQKWGVIAKTIDRNNENLYYYSTPTSGVIEKNDNDKIFLLAVTSLWLEVLDESTPLPNKLYCTYLGNTSGNYKTVIRFDDVSGKTYFSRTYNDGPKSGVEELQIYAASASGVSGKYILHVIINWDSITDQYLRPNTEINTSSLNKQEVTSKLSQKDKISSLETRISVLENNSNNLSGKTILCLGDSITEFVEESGVNPKGYVEYLAEYSGATVIRGGIGGAQLGVRTTVVDTPTSVSQAYAALDIPSIAQALCNKDWGKQVNAAEYIKDNANDDNTHIVSSLSKVDISQVDIVTVFGGTNDYSKSDLGEIDSLDEHTLTGGLNVIISSLLTANPRLSIYVFTPIARYFNNSRWDDQYWSDNYNDGILVKIVETIQEVTKKNHVPCCDMYYTMGWNKYNWDIYFSRLTDGTHPYSGFSQIASKMLSFITSNKIFS